MKKSFVIVAFLLFGIVTLYAQPRALIVHTVKEGETLYRISVNYQTKLTDVKVLNPHIVGDKISKGDIVKIPYLAGLPVSKEDNIEIHADGKAIPMPTHPSKKPCPQPAPPKKKETAKKETTKKKAPAKKNSGVSVDDIRPRKHAVKANETLFSIAKKYNQNINALRNWNDLTSVNIGIDQELIVGWVFPNAKKTKKSKTASTPTPPKKANKPKKTSKPSSKNTSTTKTTTKAAPTAAVPVAKPKPSPPPAPKKAKPVKTKPTRFQKSYWAKAKDKSYRSLTKSGIATTFPDSGKKKDFYALHKYAAPRSIIKVTNSITGLSSYVRVLAPLPKTAANKNVLVKLSESAAKKIGILDAKTIVETKYFAKK